MNYGPVRLVIVGLTLSLLGITNGSTVGQVSTQQRISNEIRKVFGPELKSHSSVFPVNTAYVVKVEFDDLGLIKNMVVFHKAYLNKCESSWELPRQTFSLATREYQDILSKINQVQGLGILLETVDIGMITNQQSAVVEQYQQAFVRRSVLTPSINPGQPVTVSFRVYFMHRIQGVVESKYNTDKFGLGELFKLRIDGNWYYVAKQVFDIAVLDAKSQLIGGGPINNDLDACPD